MKQLPILFLLACFGSFFAKADNIPSDQQLQQLVVGPCDGVSQLTMHYASPKEDPVGALVLLGSYSGNSQEMSDRTRPDIQEWANIAVQNHLAFVYANVCMTKALMNEINGGSYDARKELGGLLVNGIAKAFPKQLPMCLYPYRSTFHEDLTSTDIVATLVQQMPDRITTWCLLNRLPDVNVIFQPTSPGLMLVTNDTLDWDSIKKYYDEHREKGKQWTWLNYKPIDEPKARQFICQYFESITTSPPGLWKRIDSGASPDFGDKPDTDSQVTWLPTPEVADAWQSVKSVPLVRPIIIEKIMDPNSPGAVPLHMYLRLPVGASDGSTVSGVLAFCTWVQDKRTIMQQLSWDTDRPDNEKRMTEVQMLLYAAKNNLAVLTWSTPGNWNPGTSVDELDWDSRRGIDDQFNVYASTWDQGVAELADQYHIPANDYLLYGISRGAQWAHRLALRKPDRFWAINIHISSSYDVPTPEASRCLWLVTTGDMEHGCPFAQRFYVESHQLGYPIIFKAEENLGHDSCIEVENLRDKFFDYALQLLKERREKNISQVGMAGIIAQRWGAAPFVADYLNQDVLPASQASGIPDNQKVYLPTEDIANAWAAVHVPDQLTKK